MTRRKKPAAFHTVKQAERYIDKLKTTEPGRHFHVLTHPKEPRKFAIGVMAGGVLLCGYVPQTRPAS